ncbi:ras gtpase-activating protein [Anaeramoeba flamelloides]|uniref:Ras gtpase-activating protein n=1 Tax=Anaeramoeba flamelloides TaxID=1746091 RepID=A0AAV7YB58_9EUKA|nr:ras gtpase-activating protein [Anaeramoeba flamelloides]
MTTQNTTKKENRNQKRGLTKSYSFPKKVFVAETETVESDVFTELLLKQTTGTISTETTSEQSKKLQQGNEITKTQTKTNNELDPKLNKPKKTQKKMKKMKKRKKKKKKTSNTFERLEQLEQKDKIATKQLNRRLVQSASFSIAQLNLNKFLMNKSQPDFKRLNASGNLIKTNFKTNKKKGKKRSKKKNKDPLISFDQKQLIQVITDEELELFETISQKIKKFGKNDTVIEALWTIFESKKISFEIVKFSIMNEVNETELAETLFRRNSMATKLLNVICNFFGNEYLINILKDPIAKLLEDSEDLEIDPKKISDLNGDISKNLEKLKKKTNNFFDAIFKSVEQVPFVLREVCRFIRKETKDKFPKMELTSVGAFFILRFICPAIASPENYELYDEKITPTMRRALIQTSKIIQTISNKVRFPEQSYMSQFNQFIEENEKPMFTFFDQISNQMFIREMAIEDSLVNEEQVADAVNIIKVFLEQNFEEIQDDLFKVTNRLFD